MPKLNVEFSEKQTKTLKQMADELDTTRVDVIRRALALLSVVQTELKAGNELAVVRDGKILKTILVLP